MGSIQNELFVSPKYKNEKPNKAFNSQLLKWVGNKQRQAIDIIQFFPDSYGTYFEPFLGSGGVLGTLSPEKAIASDVFSPLMDIWNGLHENEDTLKEWYEERFVLINTLGKERAYEKVLASYNKKPNGADFLFILRTCYGGVVRFRKKDGFMSTPCGTHNPMPPDNFAKRVDLWRDRTKGVQFELADFSVTMSKAKEGDLIYCDPPYVDSQRILYGAHDFSLERLFDKIDKCKKRGVFVALSIDGTKFSGGKLCNVAIPEGLFEREVFIDVGKSMLRRFQMDGKGLDEHLVTDRLLLTY